MRFYPDYLFDTNAGEDVVWRSLRTALGAEEGHAFHRYPITGPGGFVWYEPDVLLIRPLRAPLVIECKGCRTEHLVEVHGGTWTMGDLWHRPHERPLEQARNQAIALREMLAAKGASGVRVVSLVALPFLSRSDWTARFGAVAEAENVLFAEDFSTPGALRDALARRLDKAPAEGALSARVADILGAGHPAPASRPSSDAQASSAGGAPIRLLRYTGEPPTAEQLRQVIGIAQDAPHTYLVATSALERHRREEGFGGQHQVSKDLRPGSAQPEEVVLLFHKALRHFVGQRLLSRAEERTLLQRAIRDAARQDDAVAEQLRHDVSAWREVLAGLEEAGISLDAAGQGDDSDNGGGNDLADASDWAHPALRMVAAALQAAYRRQRRDLGRGGLTFEEAARQYVAGDYQPTPVVVMEGFTRLTPLQRRYVEVCAARPGVRLWIVQPYRDEQRSGFAALDRTYAPFLPGAETVRLDTPMPGAVPALRHLQGGLFSSATRPEVHPGDGSVEVRDFPHRDDEVASCVDRVIAALDDPAAPLPPGEAVVVCTDPHGMGALLRDEAEMRGRPDLFAVPPRQLLLTPVGRFALTLYEVWTPRGLCLDPGQFATFLASGWLGGQAQRSADLFLAVAEQQFAQCRTEGEWARAFDRVTAHRAAGARVLGSLYERLPASLVDEGLLEQWRTVVADVARLCRRLFRPGQRPIGDHIRLLLDEIEGLDPHRLLQAEREVLAAIREAFRELAESSRSIAIDAQEFGDVLSGLIQERAGEVDGELPGDGPDAASQRVWVVGPEGIDNVTRRAVFFLGVDDRSMPAPGLPPWPRTDWSAEEHVERQRYRFLAVTRAARERLWISCARQDWQRAYRTSMYLDEARRLLGMEAAPAVPRAPPGPPPPAVQRGEASRMRRDRYDIGELAVHGLCRYRFKLEALTGGARCYASGWQMGWLARGVWLAEAFHHYAAAHPGPGENPEAVADGLWDALGAVEGAVKDRFAGLGTLSWTTIERGVRNTIERLLQPTGSRGLPLLGIVRPPDVTASKEVAISATRTVVVTAAADYAVRRGGYTNLERLTNRAALWLRRGDEDDEIAEGAADGPHRFGRLYDAVAWWQDANFQLSLPRSLVDDHAEGLRNVLLELETGLFPKNPGDHCRYCPVHDTCMGLLP